MTIQPRKLSCVFCGSSEVLWALRDGLSSVHKPACGKCAVEEMGNYHEVVDALAVWPVRKVGRNDG